MRERTEGRAGFRLALEVWRRRKWLAVLTFSACSAGVVGVAGSLPDLYEATATVLVERQQVPEAFVRPAVTGELETRLHSISQQTLSRARLSELIARFDLYADFRARAPLEAVIHRVRRDIHLEVKEVHDRWGRGATIAFTLTYRGRDPETVARVSNDLASFYVEENTKIRERQAAGTAAFLRAQLAEMKKKLDEQERRIGAFKLRHPGELPQQVETNLVALERLNSRLTLNREHQSRAMERRERFMRELAEVRAGRPAASSDSPAARLAGLRQDLKELQTRFTDRYPDVLRVKAEIAALERQLAETTPDATPGAPDPALRRLREALGEVEVEIKTLKEEEKSLREAMAGYERRIENAPRRQQEFQELSRDYETTKELYTSLLKRYEEAQLAESMEHGQRGEQFRILDPAVPPKLPAAPNRSRLLFAGLILSLGLTAVVVLVAEWLDTSFHSVDDLRAFTSVPVLASIPRIVTPADVARRRRRFGLAAAAAGVGLALVVALSSYVAHDNEPLVRLLARGRF